MRVITENITPSGREGILLPEEVVSISADIREMSLSLSLSLALPLQHILIHTLTRSQKYVPPNNRMHIHRQHSNGNAGNCIPGTSYAFECPCKCIMDVWLSSALVVNFAARLYIYYANSMSNVC